MMAAASAADLKKITLGVRPESFHVASEAGAGAVQLRVNLVEELGADAYVHGTLLQEDEPNAKQFVVRFDGRVPPRIGDTISVEIRTGRGARVQPGDRRAPRLKRRLWPPGRHTAVRAAKTARRQQGLSARRRSRAAPVVEPRRVQSAIPA